MIWSDKVPDILDRPHERGRCFTGIMEVLAIGGAIASVASTGLSIAGASQQADAQRQAGEVAYRNALARNEAAQAEARRMEQKANSEAAIGQRQAIEKRREARILAGRAQTAMANSGAGVDEGVIAGILGEGDLAFDTALAEGDQRAQDSRYDASLRRWEGKTGVASGAGTRDALNRRASVTETLGLAQAGFGLASIASKYGGPAPDRYDLSRDTLRTAGDADLGGYTGGRVELYDNLKIF